MTAMLERNGKEIAGCRFSIMHWMTAELIKNEHPPHFTKTYLWKAIGGGPECHWVEADSVAARAAL